MKAGGGPENRWTEAAVVTAAWTAAEVVAAIDALVKAAIGFSILSSSSGFGCGLFMASTSACVITLMFGPSGRDHVVSRVIAW